MLGLLVDFLLCSTAFAVFGYGPTGPSTLALLRVLTAGALVAIAASSPTVVLP